VSRRQHSEKTCRRSAPLPYRTFHVTARAGQGSRPMDTTQSHAYTHGRSVVCTWSWSPVCVTYHRPVLLQSVSVTSSHACTHTVARADEHQVRCTAGHMKQAGGPAGSSLQRRPTTMKATQLLALLMGTQQWQLVAKSNHATSISLTTNGTCALVCMSMAWERTGKAGREIDAA
jgi:hypothetical protein